MRAVTICCLAFALFVCFALAVPPRGFVDKPEPNNQIIILLDLLVKQLCCQQYFHHCNCVEEAKIIGCTKEPSPKVCAKTRRVRRALEPNQQITNLLDLSVKQLCCHQHYIACNCKYAKEFGCREPLPGRCPQITIRKVVLPIDHKTVIVWLDHLVKDLCCLDPCSCLNAKKFGCPPKKPCPKVSGRFRLVYL